MHSNYYFLRKLSAELGTLLTGTRMGTCFSQQKDELVLGFYTAEAEYYINAVLRSDFCCLQLPEQYARSKRNNIDLFPELLDKEVTGYHQYLNERAFSLQFEAGYTLLFKMHGLRSNLLLFKEQALHSLFRNSLKGDEAIRLDALDRPLVQDYAAFEAADGRWEPLYPTLGKEVKQYLLARDWGEAALSRRWELLQETVKQLEQPNFYLRYTHGEPVLSLLPGPEQELLGTEAIPAINRFFRAYVSDFALARERAQLSKQLERQIRQSENYISKNSQKLDELSNKQQYEQWANIIMANLHTLNRGMKSAELYDFYHDQQITLKLKEALSPQKNAEVFYRKAKNQKIEINRLEANIEAKEQQLDNLRQQLEQVQSIDQLKELRRYAKAEGLQKVSKQAERSEPFTRFTEQGFEILVGKNAKANDELSLKYSYKEDLWLHAKDVTGSHVLIKHQAGKQIPARVKERAAALAAWYSKRKNDTLCPVICTPKKFVRKPKGLPPGAVMVDKELEVILIEPKGPQQDV